MRTAYRRILQPVVLLVIATMSGCTPSWGDTTAAWKAQTPPLATPWTAQVSPTNALPEYPRPQMVRHDWQNLNGVWQFAAATADDAPPFGRTLAESILVPFPVESALSGIERSEERMWYRRVFEIPAAWNERSVLLHFGAVDWQATVYVNGAEVGTHQGGYDAFALDITPNLRRGSNELVVGVYDPSDADEQPVGKQRRTPKDIFYTAASGIWQTVWLEPVAAAHITRLDLTPDLAGEALDVIVHAEGTSDHVVELTALDGTAEVGRVTGAPNTAVRLAVPRPKRWSPDDPFLYDLRVRLVQGSDAVDTVASYFGMRSVGVAKIGNVLRPVLNGEFVFQMGTLDQGYWPDGIYTAPTDEALRFDIQKHKDLGFNLIRKHVKVEPQRWYYWADKLGLLVWQDMPSMRLEEPSTQARAQFERELREVVDEHRSAPSIIMWVPFNEGWGQYDLQRIAKEVKEWDASRLVNNNSGLNCCGSRDGGNGDVVDWHIYGELQVPLPSVVRFTALGEYGGHGLAIRDHVWRVGSEFSYANEPDAAALTAYYVGEIAKIERMMARLGLSAAVYTQITDVETEVNGLLTYDRAIVKPDADAIKAANQRLIDASRTLTP